MTEPKATELYELKKEVELLKEQNRILTAGVHRANRVAEALEPLARQFGMYTDNAGRQAVALITAAFEVAGTIDVLVMDSSYSGGLREVPGVTLGTERGDFMPFLTDEPEEEESYDDLLAAKR